MTFVKSCMQCPHCRLDACVRACVHACMCACVLVYHLNYNKKSTPFCEFATFYLHTQYTKVYTIIVVIHPGGSGIINILVNLSYLHNSCKTPKRK